jgi:hypothetical protein
MAEGKKGRGKHGKAKKEEPAAEPQPGTAAMAQGQPDAGIEPADDDKPEQPDKLVTGAEALEEQQQNPDLKDNTGNRGGS